MVNYKGMARVVNLEWIAENDIRITFDYHAFSDPDISIESTVECNDQISPSLVKESIRGVIKSEYDNIPEEWDLISDDFILLNCPC